MINEGLDGFLKELQEYVDKNFDTRDEAAAKFGVGRNFLWAVIDGSKRPNDKMLEVLGYKRTKVTTTTYEKEKDNA